MKFGQLIEFNMKNIFLKNHAQNVVGKLLPLLPHDRLLPFNPTLLNITFSVW